MKIELGGTLRASKGFQEVNCDWQAVANGTAKIPLGDDTVDECFSSHLLQRFSPFRGLLNEMCRVCHIGAKVEIHVPHWLNSMAMCEGQRFTFDVQQAQHLCRDFVDRAGWTGPKRLALESHKLIGSSCFKECQGIFPHLTDDQIMRFIPGACHEIQFHFTVVPMS